MKISKFYVYLASYTICLCILAQSRYSEKPIYEVPEKPALEKPSTSNKWDLICDKMDVVHGRCGRSLKEEKKHIHDRDASPVPFDQERDDAIAELDSVIDSYHCKHSHHHKSKEMDKNGGTWPKVRGGPLIEHKTGTIMHPRKNKERLPLSVLLNNPPNYNFPPCCQRPEEQRSSIAQKDGGIDFSVKSGNIGKELIYICVVFVILLYFISRIVKEVLLIQN